MGKKLENPLGFCFSNSTETLGLGEAALGGFLQVGGLRTLASPERSFRS